MDDPTIEVTEDGEEKSQLHFMIRLMMVEETGQAGRDADQGVARGDGVYEGQLSEKKRAARAK